MTLVMGMDQHRAQISAEWIDTLSGEVSRARVAPADRAGVRRFLERFDGEDLEVALFLVVVGYLQAGGRVDAACQEHTKNRECSDGSLHGRSLVARHRRPIPRLVLQESIRGGKI